MADTSAIQGSPAVNISGAGQSVSTANNNVTTDEAYNGPDIGTLLKNQKEEENKKLAYTGTIGNLLNGSAHPPTQAASAFQA